MPPVLLVVMTDIGLYVQIFVRNGSGTHDVGRTGEIQIMGKGTVQIYTDVKIPARHGYGHIFGFGPIV